MRKLLFATILGVVTLAPASASAQSDKTDFVKLLQGNPVSQSLSISKPVQATQEPPKAPEPPKPTQPTVYVVVDGDSLVKIGTAHNVEWQRLWAKNTQLTHPDIIMVGEKITVPLPDEQLSRELPAVVQLPVVTPNVSTGSSPTVHNPKPTFQARGTVAGNGYDYGYCTWYVKNRRPDLPNNLGNAHSWYGSAQRQGIPTGSAPAVGAVGVSFGGSLGHVVYVEAVHGNGTITVSEMNYKGWGIQSSRTASASEFSYIY